uniref:Uncharacterized protein n=1 Tax=Streptomyces sp. NBC_01393 TaxID=2903851 RepID=A0AAU3IDC2_9ACTN
MRDIEGACLITNHADGIRVCSEAEYHCWPDDGRGRGCPFCAGHCVSSTNRFSDLCRDDVPRSDTERSGITADHLRFGSSHVVLWKCDINLAHPPFPRSVNAFTGGGKAMEPKRAPSAAWRGPVGTLVQELQMEAELATVLRTDHMNSRLELDLTATAATAPGRRRPQGEAAPAQE